MRTKTWCVSAFLLSQRRISAYLIIGFDRSITYIVALLANHHRFFVDSKVRTRSKSFLRFVLNYFSHYCERVCPSIGWSVHHIQLQANEDLSTLLLLKFLHARYISQRRSSAYLVIWLDQLTPLMAALMANLDHSFIVYEVLSFLLPVFCSRFDFYRLEYVSHFTCYELYL